MRQNHSHLGSFKSLLDLSKNNPQAKIEYAVFQKRKNCAGVTIFGIGRTQFHLAKGGFVTKITNCKCLNTELDH